MFYYNESGEKIGPIRGRELKALAQQGTITPNTRVEDERGRTALAKQVTGLTFPEMVLTDSPIPIPPVAQPTHTVPIPQPLEAKQVFCTNCGNAVSERANAFMATD